MAGWLRPRGAVAWSLTVAAALMLALTSLAGFYMLVPIDFAGPGILGLVALLFPLHLLVVTALAAGLGLLAWRRSTGLTACGFALVAALTAVMALAPTIVLWRYASAASVPVLLGDYVETALQPNLGGPQLRRTVAYATAPDDDALALDVWPAEPANDLHSAIVRVHGGGWVHGARGDMPEWDSWLAGLGYTVFDIGYRLSPRAGWRDEIGDVKCALGWIAAHAVQYRLDPARISIMGQSAGGNLAMLAAYSVGDPELPPSCPVSPVTLRAVVNLYGPADLTRIEQSGSVAFVSDVLGRYVGGTAAAFPERYRVLSPVNHVSAASPPTLTVLGTSDRIISLDQSELLDRALTKAGVAHETVLLPASDHAFDVNWGGFATQIARNRIARFLSRYAGP